METIAIREIRGTVLREKVRGGKPLAITNRGALIGVMIPVAQAWVERLIDYNWSRVRQSIEEGERAIADGNTPMLTLDDVVSQADTRGYGEVPGHGSPESLAVPLVAAVVGGSVIQPPETRETLERLRELLNPAGAAEGASKLPSILTVRIGDLSARVILEAGADGHALALTNDRELVGIVIPVTQGLVEFLLEQNMSRVLDNIALDEKQLKTPEKMTTLNEVLEQASQRGKVDPSSVAAPSPTPPSNRRVRVTTRAPAAARTDDR